MVLNTVAVWLIGLPLSVVMFCLVALAFVFDRSGDSLNVIGRYWARSILFLSGATLEIKGFEKIPAGPVVFASNHRAAFDIMVLQGYMPVQFRWLAKKSLFSIPLLGWAMTLARHVPIERGHAGQAYRSIEEAADRIKKGTSVVVFPEGTRSTSEKLLPFKRGMFMLASKSEAPIVPVAMSGTAGIVGRWSVVFKPARVTFSVGDPIPTKGVDENELKERTREAIEGLLGLTEGLKEASR